jgi:hypothetical protein
MLFLRTGTHPGSRKERPVDILAMYVANEITRAEREKAFERAMAHRLPAGPSLRNRIASAAAGLRRFIGNPADQAGVLPKLEDYPYRS